MTNQLSNDNPIYGRKEDAMPVGTTSSAFISTPDEIIRAPDVQSKAKVDHEIPSLDLFLHPVGPESTKSDTATASRATKNFKLFPNLPVELRLIIWQFALATKRYVSIKHDMPPFIYRHGPPTWHPSCADRAPAPFFVCHEARQEVTKIYMPLRGTACGFGRVWMDVKKDVLCFSRQRFEPNHMTSFVDGLPADFRNGLAYIAADDMSSRYTWYAQGPFVDNLYKFPALANLTVLEHSDPEADNGRGISEIVEWESSSLNYSSEIIGREVEVVKAKYPQRKWVEPLMNTGRTIYVDSPEDRHRRSKTTDLSYLEWLRL
jgi:hypothetical protein